ncbi:MAG: amino acid ABC transporter permease [Lachnospiraceae bacterium]|nr:amino acid ABC transporter permease [Lachnospiraceae bacterium]
MGFEVLFKGSNMLRLLSGLGVALRISLVSVLISIGAGLVLGSLMTVKKPVINVLSKIYLEFFRIMPQMVLLFLVYFGTTKVLGVNMSAETASVIVFSLWGTAEMSDLVRGALKGIPTAQYESSYALGLNVRQTYIHIIIPQIIRRMLPLSINLVTRMIKTTGIVMMIGIVEILKVGQQIIEANRKTSPDAAFGVFATIFVLYFLVCWPISILSKHLEKKWES